MGRRSNAINRYRHGRQDHYHLCRHGKAHSKSSFARRQVTVRWKLSQHPTRAISTPDRYQPAPFDSMIRSRFLRDHQESSSSLIITGICTLYHHHRQLLHFSREPTSESQKRAPPETHRPVRQEPTTGPKSSSSCSTTNERITVVWPNLATTLLCHSWPPQYTHCSRRTIIIR
jgi:hypothetical protein